MEIVTRFKGNNGITEGYLIKHNGKNTYVPAEQAISMSAFIDNAVLTKNRDFRAKPGHTIDTVLSKDALKSVKKNENAIVAEPKGTLIESEKQKADGVAFIKLCKDIRRKAIEGKIRVEETRHKSNNGANIHLFKLIEACGITVYDFIRGYLSVLQPCFLEYYSDNKKNFICVSDTCYKIKLLIKIDSSNANSYLVVSFHESNFNGRSRLGKHKRLDTDCIVLTDTVEEISDNLYRVFYTVQRGFLRLRVKSITKQYKNGVAIVKYEDIKDLFDKVVRDSLLSIEDYYGSDSSAVALYKGESLSFMAHGGTDINLICLMLDLFSSNTSTKERRLISNITGDLISGMSRARQLELKVALENKFKLANKNYGTPLLDYINGVIDNEA